MLQPSFEALIGICGYMPDASKSVIEFSHKNKKMDKEISTKIALFRGRKIRRIIHNDEWWFSVVDVVETLTDSLKPNDYWYKMKIRVKSEDGFELSTICRQLKLESGDGKKYETSQTLFS